MAIETREKQIGKHVYVVEQFGAKQGRGVLFRLLRTLGPAFAALAGRTDEGAEAALSGAVKAFAETANEADFEAICDAFASKSKIKREAQTSAGVQMVAVDLAPLFDEHFASNYGEMIAWLVFAIETNFADFLDVVPHYAQRAAADR